MSEAALVVLAALASLAGMALFALALPAHWAQVAGAHAPLSPTVQRRLRAGGALALAGSLGLCLAVDHPSMAVLVWVMLLAVSAAGVAMWLSRRPA
ncbi:MULTISPECIES: DUF3325 family protein [Hydrogenophaga]|uniref:DUF3325 domain-containing protein n=1 Tax=Hydrogenophaga intermedia TaxID=65786 RepID=A0A1L1P935_HYDIT|nr:MULTISPECIES: DUF3325 family protein [Hydrogenophaga]AOS77619.1 hypothetical protein Q5W_00810 [Hydrogenophaga sp. PBC]TMU75774.1 DUF3325 domain-containing protein [Hydrogenophaga intermedia]CDN86278.1 Putative uncharacterized protein precursor [Hydrogenophaga intermedia]